MAEVEQAGLEVVVVVAYLESLPEDNLLRLRVALLVVELPQLVVEEVACSDKEQAQEEVDPCLELPSLRMPQNLRRTKVCSVSSKSQLQVAVPFSEPTLEVPELHPKKLHR